MFGAGKTASLALVVGYLAAFSKVKILLASKENAAMRAMAAFLQDALPGLRGAERRREVLAAGRLPTAAGRAGQLIRDLAHRRELTENMRSAASSTS